MSKTKSKYSLTFNLKSQIEDQKLKNPKTVPTQNFVHYINNLNAQISPFNKIASHCFAQVLTHSRECQLFRVALYT